MLARRSARENGKVIKRARMRRAFAFKTRAPDSSESCMAPRHCGLGGDRNEAILPHNDLLFQLNLDLDFIGCAFILVLQHISTSLLHLKPNSKMLILEFFSVKRSQNPTISENSPLMAFIVHIYV